MCEYSTHAPHRQAKAKEHLIVQSVLGGLHGLYSTAGDSRMVCTKKGTKAIVKKVRFVASNGTVPSQWEGKRNVAVTLERIPHYDVIKFSDKSSVYLTQVAQGTCIDIGYPVRKRAPKKITGKKGMAVVAQALAEVKKTKTRAPRRRAKTTAKA